MIELYTSLILAMGQASYNEAIIAGHSSQADDILLATYVNYSACRNNPIRCKEAYNDQIIVRQQHLEKLSSKTYLL